MTEVDDSASSGRRAERHQPATIEDRDPVRDLLDVAEIVARQQDRDALVPEAADQRAGRPPSLDVHASRRLVEGDECRPADEREHEPEPLPLAARQPAEARPGGGRQAHQREQLIGVARRGVEPSVEPENLAGRHSRIDPASTLEHEPDSRPVIPPGSGRIDAEHAYVPTIRPAVALDDLDRRRLPCAVRAEQRERLALFDPERHVAEDGSPGVRLCQPIDLDRRDAPVGGRGHEPPEIRPYCRSKSAARSSPIWIDRRTPSRSMK